MFLLQGCFVPAENRCQCHHLRWCSWCFLRSCAHCIASVVTLLELICVHYYHRNKILHDLQFKDITAYHTIFSKSGHRHITTHEHLMPCAPHVTPGSCYVHPCCLHHVALTTPRPTQNQLHIMYAESPKTHGGLAYRLLKVAHVIVIMVAVAIYFQASSFQKRCVASNHRVSHNQICRLPICPTCHIHIPSETSSCSYSWIRVYGNDPCQLHPHLSHLSVGEPSNQPHIAKDRCSNDLLHIKARPPVTPHVVYDVEPIGTNAKHTCVHTCMHI